MFAETVGQVVFVCAGEGLQGGDHLVSDSVEFALEHFELVFVEHVLGEVAACAAAEVDLPPAAGRARPVDRAGEG